jgi:hypothetical protein
MYEQIFHTSLVIYQGQFRSFGSSLLHVFSNLVWTYWFGCKKKCQPPIWFHSDFCCSTDKGYLCATPSLEDLDSYLIAKGLKCFEVYVCVMLERDYTLEIWRLLNPDSKLIKSQNSINVVALLWIFMSYILGSILLVYIKFVILKPIGSALCFYFVYVIVYDQLCFSKSRSSPCKQSPLEFY